jgi:hypothetical protein
MDGLEIRASGWQALLVVLALAVVSFGSAVAGMFMLAPALAANVEGVTRVRIAVEQNVGKLLQGTNEQFAKQDRRIATLEARK